MTDPRSAAPSDSPDPSYDAVILEIAAQLGIAAISLNSEAVDCIVVELQQRNLPERRSHIRQVIAAAALEDKAAPAPGMEVGQRSEELKRRMAPPPPEMSERVQQLAAESEIPAAEAVEGARWERRRRPRRHLLRRLVSFMFRPDIEPVWEMAIVCIIAIAGVLLVLLSAPS